MLFGLPLPGAPAEAPASAPPLTFTPEVIAHPPTSGLTQDALAAFDSAAGRAGVRRRSLSSVSQQSIQKAIGTLGVEAADAVVASTMIGELNKNSLARKAPTEKVHYNSAIKALEREGLHISDEVEKRISGDKHASAPTPPTTYGHHSTGQASQCCAVQ